MDKFSPLLFGLFLVLALCSCHPSKHLSEQDFLYKGAALSLNDPAKDQPKKKLQSELLLKIRQKPNSKILGQRFRLWVYQKMRNNHKEKGILYWLKNKVGEVPVLYNEQLTNQSRLLMEKHLRDNGFLNARVSIDTLVGKQMVEVVYRINGQGQFKLRDYFLPPDTTRLLQVFQEKNKKSKIRLGDAYQLAVIDEERVRLRNLARENGFYEFGQTDLFFYLDTAIHQSHSFDLYLAIKSPADQVDYRPHLLGDVTIYPDYNLNKSTNTNSPKDTIRNGSWKMIQSREVVRLSAIQEAIAQDSGAVYNEVLEKQAINYLLDLGTFKFVNLQYEKKIVDSQTVLQRYFYLTPNLNQDFGVELEASTERSNFLGSSIGGHYTHRNIFKGAEQFKTGLAFGIETQAGNVGPFVNTLETSFDAGLTFPRLLLPFKVTHRLRGAIPKTLINLKATYQRRNTLFTSISLLTELGYSWKQTQLFQHQFYPLQFTLLRLPSKSATFTQELLNNPRLQASFNNLAIVAANYRFSFSNQQLNSRKNFLYLKGEVETAGNFANLLSGQAGTLFGSPIAQFARVQAEGRYTFYQAKSSLVTRLLGGLAVPYGNSNAVPYIRQFFVGGSSSIRAFRFRSIGPGSYAPNNPINSNLVFFDRVGDVKLEANVEYRFPLISYLNGAIFFDAGNIWLVRQAGQALPEGKFEWNDFHRELAVGTGIGLRLDIQFVVLRFDVGLPLRDPSLPLGDRWTHRKIQFGNKTWRQENLKYNLAIGYPF